MINIKTPEEIKLIRQAGKIAAQALEKVLAASVPGKTLLELDQLAQEIILESGAKPSFKMEPGYKWTTCMCLNDVVVHGIPTDEKISDGDILCVDLGAYYQGLHADTSWTIIVGQQDNPKNLEFLATGEKALEESIKQCVVGNHVGNISETMQKIVEGGGYSCVKQLVGHGVGKELHEDPQVPCFSRGKINRTPKLVNGMVLAVEVIYNMGKSPVVYKNDDGWTIVTRDGLPSAVFEQTVAITDSGPQVLTKL